ncbi:hypothetical protein H0H93_010557 [Arthromyces matolae]|nr:hypothetical protein H0H93_010557 [Arthromyces matolae]
MASCLPQLLFRTHLRKVVRQSVSNTMAKPADVEEQSPPGDLEESTDNSDEAQLHHLRSHVNPSFFSLSALEDEDPSAFEVLRKDAADGRQALAENLILTTEYAKPDAKLGAKKAAGKSSRTGSRTPAPTNSDPMSEFVSRIKALEEGRDNYTRRLKALEEGRDNDTRRIKALEEDRTKDRDELNKLRNRLTALGRTTGPVWRRVLLDNAKTKLLKTCNLTMEGYIDRTDDLITAILTHLSSNHDHDAQHVQTRPHLDLIFKPSTIRSEGNGAAHQASEDDIGEAVLGVGLSGEHRRKMRDIYIYVYGVPPELKTLGKDSVGKYWTDSASAPVSD